MWLFRRLNEHLSLVVVVNSNFQKSHIEMAGTIIYSLGVSAVDSFELYVSMFTFLTAIFTAQEH